MLKNNKIWLLINLVSFGLVALSSLQSKNLPIKLSVYLGILYLCLSMIPNNLALILPANLKKWPQFVAKYKRDFGISAGLMFLTHASLAWNLFGDFKLDFIFRGEIILGLLANIIFVALLLTSNQWSKKVLKKNWKRLHILVWAAVPLAFFHSSLAGMYYQNELSRIALVGFGSLYLLAFIQLFFKKWQHFVVIVVSWLISIIIISVFYPQTLTDFNESLNPSSSSSASISSSSSSSQSLSSSVSSSINQSISSSSSSTSSLVSSSEIATPSNNISSSQLADNKSSANCWVSFDKKVYNVTNYLSRHPGGRTELLRACGTEIDSLSNNHQGGNFDSSRIQNILGPFYVGDLV
jgi:DMSO/TMAO reductase YedYZ heme-binding membrane subunit/cytochrome b involved in lipid metabolism